MSLGDRPSPSAIWVCDRMSCMRRRRKRSPWIFYKIYKLTAINSQNSYNPSRTSFCLSRRYSIRGVGCKGEFWRCDVTNVGNEMNYQARNITDDAILSPSSYQSEIRAAEALLKDMPTWNGVTAEAVARMRLQNRFKTGLDVARYTAALMRADMAAYDADPTKYTQSLGCWHGFFVLLLLFSVLLFFGGLSV